MIVQTSNNGENNMQVPGFEQTISLEIGKIRKQFNCSETQAKIVFNLALENMATYAQLWFSIGNAATTLGLKKK